MAAVTDKIPHWQKIFPIENKIATRYFQLKTHSKIFCIGDVFLFQINHHCSFILFEYQQQSIISAIEGGKCWHVLQRGQLPRTRRLSNCITKKHTRLHEWTYTSQLAGAAWDRNGSKSELLKRVKQATLIKVMRPTCATLVSKIEQPCCVKISGCAVHLSNGPHPPWWKLVGGLLLRMEQWATL